MVYSLYVDTELNATFLLGHCSEGFRLFFSRPQFAFEGRHLHHPERNGDATILLLSESLPSGGCKLLVVLACACFLQCLLRLTPCRAFRATFKSRIDPA